MDQSIKEALKSDKTIDIITTGAKSGLPRKHEIWFHNLDGRIIICGTPDGKGEGGPRKPRDWMANLKANPHFTFCLKETVQAELPAKAVIISDPDDRKAIMSAPETKYYRENTSLEDLLENSPIVEVFFV